MSNYWDYLDGMSFIESILVAGIGGLVAGVTIPWFYYCFFHPETSDNSIVSSAITFTFGAVVLPVAYILSFFISEEVEV